MDIQDCDNIETIQQQGSDGLTILLTIFIILIAIITAELNKD